MPKFPLRLCVQNVLPYLLHSVSFAYILCILCFFFCLFVFEFSFCFFFFVVVVGVRVPVDDNVEMG